MRYTGSPDGSILRPSRSIALGVALAVVGCSEIATSPEPAMPPATSQIARALAVAMSDPAVRQSVRDALRQSLVDEHKIVLQDFLASADGARLRTAAGEASGLGAEGFAKLLREVPRLDFSMPVREHRRAWKLEQPFAVMGPNDDNGGTYVAYRPDGSEVRVAPKDAVAQLPAFFYVQPEERKGHRVHPQAATAGDVIEDADDGPGSQRLMIRYGTGDSVVYDMADPKARRSLLSSVSGPADTTILHAFRVNSCDTDGCFGDLEVRVELGLYNAAGTQLAFATYWQGNVQGAQWQYPQYPILFARLVEGSGGYYRSTIIEEDRDDPFGFNKDDFCGTVTFGSGGNGLVQYTPPVGGDCYMDLSPDYSAAVWFRWTPKPPPPPPGPAPVPTIRWGPSQVRRGATCSWEGDVSGGTPPYTYSWYAGSSYIGSGTYVEYTAPGSFGFPLKFQVRDATGAVGEVTKSITVSSSAPMCTI